MPPTVPKRCHEVTNWDYCKPSGVCHSDVVLQAGNHGPHFLEPLGHQGSRALLNASNLKFPLPPFVPLVPVVVAHLFPNLQRSNFSPLRILVPSCEPHHPPRTANRAPPLCSPALKRPSTRHRRHSYPESHQSGARPGSIGCPKDTADRPRQIENHEQQTPHIHLKTAPHPVNSRITPRRHDPRTPSFRHRR
jgi:hypothetical protein